MEISLPGLVSRVGMNSKRNTISQGEWLNYSNVSTISELLTSSIYISQGDWLNYTTVVRVRS